jgi:multiple sugar transport system permease protein
MTSKKLSIERLIVYIVLLLGGLLMVMPLIWAVLTSFKTQFDAMQTPPSLFPKQWIIDNYKNLFVQLHFGLYTKNSLILVVFSFLGLLINLMAGYGFAKFKFKGKEKIYYLILATMMIPGQATMIPNYLILNKLNLTNTMAGMIIPGLAVAFSIFLFRQFIETVPDELIEAARIDGAGNIRIFIQIIIPICKPILAVQTILGVIGAWNNFLWPLVVANSQDLYPLSVGLQLLQGQNVSNFALQMAGSSVMILPVIIVFLFFQKYIVEGFTTSGLK